MGLLVSRYAAKPSPKAPKRIQKLQTVLNELWTDESHQKGSQYHPQPSDVIISTGTRCGTTWVQQICHGLRSHGDMNLDEIGWVFPHLELAYDYGYQDLQAPQSFQPHMYKTHLAYDFCPKGAGKYIVIVRYPPDSAFSFYHFFLDWKFSRDEISPDTFVQWVCLKNGVPDEFSKFPSNFYHIVNWYPHRMDDNVLWLHYEDFKQDLRGCVRIIAEFLQVGHEDEKLQELVTQQASFKFMSHYSSKYDSNPIKILERGNYEFPPYSDRCGPIIRRKGIWNWKNGLSKRTISKFDQKWKEIVTPELGYASYEEMRAGINRELGRHFGENHN